MIAMRFYSDLFHGIVDTIRFLGIDYTPKNNGLQSESARNIISMFRGVLSDF